MIFLEILSILLGVVFTFFGYFIFFRKKYFLINGFEEDYRAGQKSEAYARNVGLVELVVGIVLLVASVVLFILI